MKSRTGVALASAAAAHALFAAVVWKITRRQEAQWRDLELRRQAPRPTADALR
jgi:hypothetical protein